MTPLATSAFGRIFPPLIKQRLTTSCNCKKLNQTFFLIDTKKPLPKATKLVYPLLSLRENSLAKQCGHLVCLASPFLAAASNIALMLTIRKCSGITSLCLLLTGTNRALSLCVKLKPTILVPNGFMPSLHLGNGTIFLLGKVLTWPTTLKKASRRKSYWLLLSPMGGIQGKMASLLTRKLLVPLNCS